MVAANRDFIDELDAAIGCQQCGGQLGNSPSDDFCSPRCQTAWSAARAKPLTSYTEPDDQAAHVANLVELHSPETCVACSEGRHHGRRALPGSLAALLFASGARRRPQPAPQVHIEFVPSPLRQFAEQVRRNQEQVERFGQVLTGQIQVAPASESPDLGSPNWRDIGHVREGFTFGFDPATQDGGGSLAAVTRRDGVDQVVVLSPGGFLLPRDLDEQVRTVAQEIGEAWAAAWHNIEPVVDEAFRAMSTSVEQAFRGLAPLAEALRSTPPEDPRERALWLRQHRNTGPAARSARAPRAINPRRGR